MKQKIFLNFKSFIPSAVPNFAVLGILNFFSKSISSKLIDSNYKSNVIQWIKLKNEATVNGYIVRQSALKGMWLGREKCIVNSCEVIAVYNALLFYGVDIDFSKLISEFEKDGLSLWGKFGSPVKTMKSVLEKNGFVLNECKNINTFMEKTINNEQGPIGYTCNFESENPIIVTYYNDKTDITKMIHTVSIIKFNNYFKVFNAGIEKARFNTLQEAYNWINQFPRKVIWIGVVKNKERKDY